MLAMSVNFLIILFVGTMGVGCWVLGVGLFKNFEFRFIAVRGNLD